MITVLDPRGYLQYNLLRTGCSAVAVIVFFFHPPGKGGFPGPPCGLPGLV